MTTKQILSIVIVAVVFLSGFGWTTYYLGEEHQARKDASAEVRRDTMVAQDTIIVHDTTFYAVHGKVVHVIDSGSVRVFDSLSKNSDSLEQVVQYLAQGFYGDARDSFTTAEITSFPITRNFDIHFHHNPFIVSVNTITNTKPVVMPVTPEEWWKVWGARILILLIGFGLGRI